MKKESNVTTETTTEITKELESVETVVFGKRDMNAYNSLLSKIEKGLVKASDAYVDIACAIWQVYQSEYFRIENYKNISEFGEAKYGYKKQQTMNYINLISKFGEMVNGKPVGLKEEFQGFKSSQLIYMLKFTPEQIEAVKPDWSVREIIEFGKKPFALQVDKDKSASDGNEALEPESDNTESAESMQAYLTALEIESGRTMLIEFTDFSELERAKETVLNAYNDLRTDKNFAKKKVRFVLELAYD